MKNKCCVDGCDNEAKYKSAGVCHACYQSLYYWQRKTPTAVLSRRRQLHKLEARMSILQPKVRLHKRSA